jgi:hypothetical protein
MYFTFLLGCLFPMFEFSKDLQPFGLEIRAASSPVSISRTELQVGNGVMA